MIPLVLLLAGGPVFQDTAAIDRAVAAFTTHSVGQEGGARTPVDTRLRLSTCPMVSLSWRTEGHDAVVVACAGPEWRLFVPVIRPTGAATPAASPASIGAIAQAAVKAPPVIKRGDPVLVEAGTDGFSVTREGIALGDAPPGGRFLVKVEDAKGPVQAMATADGRAVLPGWTQ